MDAGRLASRVAIAHHILFEINSTNVETPGPAWRPAPVGDVFRSFIELTCDILLTSTRPEGRRRRWKRALIVGVVSGWLAWSRFIPRPLAFHSICLGAIAAIYLGFACSDGRLSIMVLESSIATVFIILACLGLWLAPVLIAIGLIGHGIWDLAHRPRGITTKLPAWYPPFCAAYDFVFGGIFLFLAGELAGPTG